MQKLITVTIDVEKLQQASTGAFTVTEVEEINALLEEGWAVEEFEFISGEEESSKAVMLVVLNDSPEEEGFGDLFNMEEDEEDDPTKRMRTDGTENADKEDSEEEEERMNIPTSAH